MTIPQSHRPGLKSARPMVTVGPGQKPDRKKISGAGSASEERYFGT